MISPQTHTPDSTPAYCISYLIQCEELGIYERFNNADSALRFAYELALDFPHVVIEGYICHYQIGGTA